MKYQTRLKYQIGHKTRNSHKTTSKNIVEKQHQVTAFLAGWCVYLQQHYRQTRTFQGAEEALGQNSLPPKPPCTRAWTFPHGKLGLSDKSRSTWHRVLRAASLQAAPVPLAPWFVKETIKSCISNGAIRVQACLSSRGRKRMEGKGRAGEDEPSWLQVC